MKIAQHAQNTIPGQATGQLVGLEQDGILQVSNCFSIPPSTTGSDDNSDYSMEYTLSMLRSFRDTNIDHEAVGWYVTVSAGSLFSQYIIDTQFSFQQNIAQSVVIAFDPAQSIDGSICMGAYRLSDAFMDLYRSCSSELTGGKKLVTCDMLSKHGILQSRDIFVPIPMVITKSSFTRAMLHLYSPELTPATCDHLKLTSSTKLIERGMEELGRCLEGYTQEQYKWNRYMQQYTRQQQIIQHHTYKRRMENQRRVAAGEQPLPEDDIAAGFRQLSEPSKLDGILLQARIGEYCDQISDQSYRGHLKLNMAKQLGAHSL